MNLALILEAVIAAFKFPSEVIRLVRLFQGTEVEAREKIMTQIEAEAESLRKTGRPTWG